MRDGDRMNALLPSRRALFLTLATLFVGASLTAAVKLSADQVASQEQQSLEAFLGWREPGSALRWVEEQQALEDEVADCMRDAGFNYEQVSYSLIERSLRLEEDMPEAEYVAKYGYGASTLIEAQLTTDPNLTIVQQLEDEDAERYNQALWGRDEGDKDAPGRGTETGGCRARAETKVYGSAPKAAALLQGYIEELSLRINSDAQLVRARRAWSECMRGQGWAFRTPGEARTHVQRRADDLALRIRMIRGNDAKYSTEEIDQELAALQVEERAMAGDDLRCRKQHLSDSLLKSIHAKYEGPFIREHEELLRQLRQR
jgi:hypothetical protein